MVQLLQHRTWMLYVHKFLLCVTTCVQVFAQSTGDSTVKPASPRSFSLGRMHSQCERRRYDAGTADGTKSRNTYEHLPLKFVAS
jgi:hypothetical protein